MPRMSQADLDQVMQDHPALNSEGIQINWTWYSALGADKRKEMFQKDREQLRGRLHECNIVCAWLARAPKLRTLSTTRSSYGIKHYLEGDTGHYVSNGAFVAAALFMGFDAKPTDNTSPNAFLNIPFAFYKNMERAL